MSNYTKPKIKPFHLKDSPHDWWSEFVDSIKLAEQKNHEIYQTARSAYADMLKAAEKVYGATSKQMRYLKSNPPESAPNFARLKRNMLNKWLAFLEQEERRQYTRDYRQRQKEAIERLENAGYVPNEDFSRSKAISFEKRLTEDNETMRVEEYRRYEA